MLHFSFPESRLYLSNRINSVERHEKIGWKLSGQIFSSSFYKEWKTCFDGLVRHYSGGLPKLLSAWPREGCWTLFFFFKYIKVWWKN